MNGLAPAVATGSRATSAGALSSRVTITAPRAATSIPRTTIRAIIPRDRPRAGGGGACGTTGCGGVSTEITLPRAAGPRTGPDVRRDLGAPTRCVSRRATPSLVRVELAPNGAAGDYSEDTCSVGPSTEPSPRRRYNPRLAMYCTTPSGTRYQTGSPAA